jgi:hypothetical protein
MQVLDFVPQFPQTWSSFSPALHIAEGSSTHDVGSPQAQSS